MDPHGDVNIRALRLAAIVEGSDDAIVSKDTDGIITSWNAAAERMFGYSAAEAIGKSIRLIIPPERQAEEDMVLARIRRGERVDHFETRRRRRSGELIDVSITVSPIRTPDGRVIGASKIARDITERKRTELALAEARAQQAELHRRLTAIIDASGALLQSPRLEDVLPAIGVMARQVLPADGVAVWRQTDRAWRVVAAHGLSETFTAVSLEQAAPALASDVVVLSVDDILADSRRDAYRAEGIVTLLLVPLRSEAGLNAALAFYYRSPHVCSTMERDTAAGLGRLASAAVAAAELYDSQRRRRIEADILAEAGALLAAASDIEDALQRLASRLVHRTVDWCVVHLLDEHGRLVCRALEAARRGDRRLLEAVVARDTLDTGDAFSVERVCETGVALLIDSWEGDACRGCAQARHDAAQRAEVGSVVVVPLIAHGRTLGTMSLGVHRSRRRFGDAELRFAQELAYRVAISADNLQSYEEARTANRLKDEFLANLSHELRTPLNAIVGYSQMLSRGSMPDDRKPRAYEVLDKNASVLTQMVADILDLSRIVSGKLRLDLRSVPLAQVVRHAVATVQPGADAKGVHVQLQADDRVMVAADPDRLQQVFWNLLSNAVKFTPRDGRIDVRVVGHTDGSEVVMTDTGIGIDPRMLASIFERFRQADSRHGREHGGLGLGLSIARQLAEMHGGSIIAESEGHGRGSTFRVRLPAVPA